MSIRELIQAVKLNTTDSMPLRAGSVGGFARLFAVLGVTSIVAACSTVNETTRAAAYADGCMAERADIVDAADWDGVQPNKITIVNGDIRPMVMSLEENETKLIQHMEDFGWPASEMIKKKRLRIQRINPNK